MDSAANPRNALPSFDVDRNLRRARGFVVHETLRERAGALPRLHATRCGGWRFLVRSRRSAIAASTIVRR
jgi:hypothetical protein